MITLKSEEIIYQVSLFHKKASAQINYSEA